MVWQLVESDAALAGLLAEHRDCRAVMVDTEFMRRDTFYPRPALVQLCFDREVQDPGPAWLIDPLAIANPQPLADLLIDQNTIKVLHSASEDLEVFQHWLGVLPSPLFDTQRAAALLDIGFGLGYRSLVQQLCGVDLPKDETRSDWLQRPLTGAQLHYAAMDVECLLPVWRLLRERCVQAGKFDWVLEDGRGAVVSGQVDPAQYYRRLKGASRLDSKALGALAAVCEWRERVARSRDKPRGWILPDQACIELARQHPETLAQLGRLDGLPAPVVRRHGEDLLQLLATQRAQPEEALPAPLSAPLTAEQKNRVSQLKEVSRAIAAELRVAPEALWSTRDCELLVRESSGEMIESPVHWQGWRDDLVRRRLRDSLRRDAT